MSGTKLFTQNTGHWKDGWDESAQEDPSVSSLRSQISKAAKEAAKDLNFKPDPPGSVSEGLEHPSLRPSTKLTPPPEVDTSKKDEVSVLSGNSHSQGSKQRSTRSRRSRRSQGSRTRGSDHGPSKHSKDPGPPSSSSASSSDYYRKKLIIRSKLNDKVYWNGLRGTFSKFEKLVDGHLFQVGVNYLLCLLYTSPSPRDA